MECCGVLQGSTIMEYCGILLGSTPVEYRGVLLCGPPVEYLRVPRSVSKLYVDNMEYFLWYSTVEYHEVPWSTFCEVSRRVLWSHTME